MRGCLARAILATSSEIRGERRYEMLIKVCSGDMCIRFA
jgi:hypothetical protein